MDKSIQHDIAILQSTDVNLRYESFQHLIKLSNQPVEWAYEVWDGLLALIKNGDNHQRTIGAQLLSNLAKSDTESRMLHDIYRLFEVTKDEKFVTARHTLQCLWKIGIVNDSLKNKLLEGLETRFSDCAVEKNRTLIRYDIIVVLRKMFNATANAEFKDAALALIEKETDVKYKKKYISEWKDVLK